MMYFGMWPGSLGMAVFQPISDNDLVENFNVTDQQIGSSTAVRNSSLMTQNKDIWGHTCLNAESGGPEDFRLAIDI